MSSILKVDTIQTTAGAAPTAKSLGFSAGSVIQTQVSRYSGNSIDFGANASYTTSNRSVTITPKSSDSIILVRYSASAYVQEGAQAYFTLYRNSTNLYNQSGYSTNASTTHQGLTQVYSQTGTSFFPCTLEYADTPSSTSALTYTLYGRSISSGKSIYWPPGSVDAATFTAMEIAQ
tara:strand:- start:220 stop:747 length:528 start_codon:yes stop_codon:yes gene_type:complete